MNEDNMYKIYPQEKNWTTIETDLNRVKEYEINYLPYIKHFKNARFLDVGCGQGFFLDFLRKHEFHSYIGVDICRDFVTICKEKGHSAECKDIFDFLTESKEFFDIIVLNDVLEHFQKDRAIKLLRIIGENLNPGGYVIIRVPNANYLFSSYSRYADLTHEMIYEKSSLEYILRLTGFEVLVCKAFKTWPKSMTRRMARNIILKLSQLIFLVCDGMSKPVEKNIFAIGRIGISKH